ncbi:M56 family metallopeptidase [Nesterenkonia lutea]|uniref:Zn-dependent protease with chaperone function n=1 Tax=Nesterenkonia lutea TaxID=272919 RepID=A0ABR9JCX2_9MICC|nr:M56 family metallopeptidase [Nesterenkonia lutea]MBE1523774.1 Zn-dependent protease with chaperone function [Nesterenkonia lutea]
MTILAACLAALALVLAISVPRLLREAKFRSRSPWAAMLLWQAIALAGGLSMVGAPMLYGLGPFGDSAPAAAAHVLRLMAEADFAALTDLGVHPGHIFALCLSVLLGGHLLLTLLLTYVRVLGQRRRHRDVVRLLSTPVDGNQASALGRHLNLSGDLVDAHVLEHEAPLAYCLPGRTHAGSVTVLSRGLLDQLSAAELGAVVAHEKTHLQQRHHFLTMAFEAWYRALPWLPTTRHGRAAVTELTEMLADDGALRAHSRQDLLRALALSSAGRDHQDVLRSAERPQRTRGGTPPETGAPARDASVAGAAPETALITTARLSRLLIPPEPLGRPALAGTLAVVAALVLVPLAALLLGS